MANSLGLLLVLGLLILLFSAQSEHFLSRQTLAPVANQVPDLTVIAVPAAAMGMIAPWGAAIGMSLSSLLVVINALRLRRD